MNNKPRFTMAEVLAAVEVGRTVRGTALKLGIGRSTMGRYVKRWPKVAEAIKDKRLDMVDIAEDGLLAHLYAREAWAIAFTLRTLAKDIYAERVQHTGADNGPIAIREVVVELGEPEPSDSEDTNAMESGTG